MLDSCQRGWTSALNRSWKCSLGLWKQCDGTGLRVELHPVGSSWPNSSFALREMVRSAVILYIFLMGLVFRGVGKECSGGWCLSCRSQLLHHGRHWTTGHFKYAWLQSPDSETSWHFIRTRPYPPSRGEKKMGCSAASETSLCHQNRKQLSPISAIDASTKLHLALCFC